MHEKSNRKTIESLSDTLGAPIPTAEMVPVCIGHIKHLQQSTSPLFHLADAVQYLQIIVETLPDPRGETRLYLFDLLLLSNQVKPAAEIARALLEEGCLEKHWEVHLRRLISARLIHERQFENVGYFLLPLFIEIPTYDVAEMVYWASSSHNASSPQRFELPTSSDGYFQFVLDRCHTELPVETRGHLRDIRLMDAVETSLCVVGTLPEMKQTLSAPPSLNQEHYISRNFGSVVAPPIRAFGLEHASVRANEWSISVFSETSKLLAPVTSRVIPAPGPDESYAWLSGRTALIADSVIQSNYCHWMFDVLPRILYLNKLGITDIDHWLVGAFNKAYQKDSLSALGIDVSSVVSLVDHPHIKADSLISLSDSSFERRAPARNAWPELLRTLRHQLCTSLNITPSSKKKRIFISRKDAGPRVIHGEDELFQALQRAHGFERYRLSELSFSEQLQLFTDAEAVVGAHGAGLTNVLFCQPETAVIEIFNPRYGTHAYAITAQALGLNYSYVCGKPLISGSLAREKYHNPELGHEDFLISEEEHQPIIDHLNAKLSNKLQQAPFREASFVNPSLISSPHYRSKNSSFIFDFYPKQGEGICKNFSGQFLEEDIRTFIKLGESLPPEGRFAQIGGQSALALFAITLGAEGNKHSRAQLFCVDPGGSPEQGAGNLSRELLRDTALSNAVTLLKVSIQVALSKFADSSLDALLIDIDSGADIFAWKRKLKDDGRFFFYSSGFDHNREPVSSDSAELALLKLNATNKRRVLEIA